VKWGKVYRYDKTYIKFDLAELVPLKFQSSCFTAQIRNQTGFAEANATLQEVESLDSDDSDMNIQD